MGRAMMANNLESAQTFAEAVAARIRSLPSTKIEPVRAVRREYSRELASCAPQFVIDVALRLLGDSVIDRFVAYELVMHHRTALARVREKQLQQLGNGIDNWGAVDCFACYLAGPAWRERQVSDRLIHRWARSRDRWWRRAALVSTVPLNNKARGGRGDAARTLDVCRLLLSDRDDMVVKAMSWALRELSKRDPKAVRRFLSAHRDQLAPRAIREVNNKLSTGLKNPKRKQIPKRSNR